MINPAKYYNPKLIPVGEFCVDFHALLTTGVCLYECCDGLFSGIKTSSLAVSKVMRMETIFFWQEG